MKRKVGLWLVMILSLALLAGCGAEENKDNNNSNNNNISNSNNNENKGIETTGELQVDNYVTLGEYKGLQVTAPSLEVDPEEKETLMRNVYYQYITKENGGITEGTVKNGDTVNIDYSGKKDGVAFDGGTASNQQLGIGSNSFIDGFESGLIGVKIGDTVDLNLTFPKEYHNADLAGQAVVFTVTVNFVYPEMKDEIVASWGEEIYTTVAELDQYVEEYLLSLAQSDYDYTVENTVISLFMQNCTFEENLPTDLVAKYRVRLMENMEAEAALYGMDAESYCQYTTGMILSDFLDAYSEVSAQQVIALQALANKEGLNRTDEEVKAAIEEASKEQGYATVEEFMGDNSLEEYKEYYVFEDTLKFLMDNAVITTQ